MAGGPARNALKPVGEKINYLIYETMLTPTQRTMHGRRVFAFSEFLLRSDWTLAARGGARMRLHEIQYHFQEVSHRRARGDRRDYL